MLEKLKLVKIKAPLLICKFHSLISIHYSLPEYLKQIEELKEHQHMLKDLKNSRTLPILQPMTVASFDLNNYCLWNLSAVTIQQPKIILPSPSPLLKESEVFYSNEHNFELTNESTPMEVNFGQKMASSGSFSNAYYALTRI